LNNFPHNAYDFDSSIPGRLLQRLSISLFDLPCSHSSDTLQRCKREFEKIMPVLLALPNLSLEPTVITRKKGARRWTTPLPSGSTVPSKLGVKHPEAREQDMGLEPYLLSEARSILQAGIVSYFTLLSVEPPRCYRTISASSAAQNSLKPFVMRFLKSPYLPSTYRG
jgi:hypothetical protein